MKNVNIFVRATGFKGKSDMTEPYEDTLIIPMTEQNAAVMIGKNNMSHGLDGEYCEAISSAIEALAFLTKDVYIDEIHYWEVEQ